MAENRQQLIPLADFCIAIVALRVQIGRKTHFFCQVKGMLQDILNGLTEGGVIFPLLTNRWIGHQLLDGLDAVELVFLCNKFFHKHLLLAEEGRNYQEKNTNCDDHHDKFGNEFPPGWQVNPTDSQSPHHDGRGRRNHIENS